MPRLHLLITLLCPLLLNQSAWAQMNMVPPKDEDLMAIEIVLDASGSMADPLDGTPKIQIAREVIREFQRDFFSPPYIGLRAYGHRHKDDCTDTELLLPLAKESLGKIGKTLDTLQPLGNTLMTYSLKEAIKDVADMNRTGLIILISDGKEVCSLDPCAEVAKLAGRLRKPLYVFTIGFGVEAEAEPQLICLANAFDGTYISAVNRDDLAHALKEVMGTLTLDAKVLFTVKDADGSEPYWPLKGTYDKNPLRVKWIETNHPFLLIPGAWTFTMNTVPPVERKVQVGAQSLATVDLGGYGNLLVTVEGAQPRKGIQTPLEVLDQATGDVLAKGFVGESLAILSGIYDLKIHVTPPRIHKGAEVKAGEVAGIIIGNQGYLRVVAKAGEEELPGEKVEIKDAVTKKLINYYQTSADISLPPGKYNVILHLPQVLEKKNVVIKEGESIAVSFDQLGRLYPFMRNPAGEEVVTKVKIGKMPGDKLVGFVETGSDYFLEAGKYKVSPASEVQFTPVIIDVFKGARANATLRMVTR